MKLLNKTSLPIEALVKKAVRLSGIPSTKNLAIIVSPGMHRFYGTATTSGSVLMFGGMDAAKMFRKKVDEYTVVDGIIRMRLANDALKYLDPLEWVERFVGVLFHELGHVWDCQRHGRSRWDNKHKYPWRDRLQEYTAERYKERKVRGTIDRMQDEILDLAVEVEKRQLNGRSPFLRSAHLESIINILVGVVNRKMK